MADATINIYGITDLETVWWGGIACSVDYISIGNSGRLVLAHVPISSGRLWQFHHATKFAVLLGFFVLLHNPISSAFWKPEALKMLGFKLKV